LPSKSEQGSRKDGSVARARYEVRWYIDVSLKEEPRVKAKSELFEVVGQILKIRVARIGKKGSEKTKGMKRAGKEREKRDDDLVVSEQ